MFLFGELGHDVPMCERIGPARVVGVAILPFLFLGCASGISLSGRDLGALAEDACRPGRGVFQVDGSIWIRAKNERRPEESGQFPADVRVTEKDGLILQVTNLVGGKEAEIRITRERVTVNGKQPLEDGSGGSWGGIPLRFATELFLGRIPCPTDLVHATLKLEEDRRLRVGAGGEEFVYTFKKSGEHLVPYHLEWRTKDKKIEFMFDDFDAESGSARKWEARGPAGEVKVKWRERKLGA